MSDFEKNQFNCTGSCDTCGSGCEDGFRPDHPTVTLTLDDDTVVECAVLTIFPANGKEYIALLPLDENGENGDGEVYLYRYTENEGGQPMLENIESDDEYDIAADAFDEMLDAAEFDELAAEDGE